MRENLVSDSFGWCINVADIINVDSFSDLIIVSWWFSTINGKVSIIYGVLKLISKRVSGKYYETT
jgi:hypothetical protein